MLNFHFSLFLSILFSSFLSLCFFILFKSSNTPTALAFKAGLRLLLLLGTAHEVKTVHHHRAISTFQNHSQLSLGLFVTDH